MVIVCALSFLLLQLMHGSGFCVDSFIFHIHNFRHNDGQVKSFFVGGPNQRKDYHIEEGEEVISLAIK